MTTFRADVTDKQMNRIDLPPPSRLNKAEALELASWASIMGVPSEDDPSAPARIKEMFGFRAAGNMHQLSNKLISRLGAHITTAAKHALILELDNDAEGPFFHTVRRRAKAPDLYIRKTSALMLLDGMGLISPLPDETRTVDIIEKRLSNSLSACVDLCMGHYHGRLGEVVEFAKANDAKTISWETIEVAAVSVRQGG